MQIQNLIFCFCFRLHGEEGADKLKMQGALSRIDVTGVLFFVGILMAIAALQVFFFTVNVFQL